MQVSQHVRQLVEDKINEYVYKARECFPVYSSVIRVPEFAFDLTESKIAGRAYRNQNKVSFNPDYIGNDDFWNTTIPHEIAHKIVFVVYPTAKQAHGPEFRYVMQLFGCDVSTYHRMETEAIIEKRPHSYACKCDTLHNISNCIHKKMQAGQVRRCNRCCEPIKYVG